MDCLTRPPRWTWWLAAACALALLAAGCGSSKGGGSSSGGNAKGKKVFVQNCGGCHTLKDAKTHGEVGPNLDDLAPDASLVKLQVKSGGGGMPSFDGQLSKTEIDQVAGYVDSATG